MPEVVFDTVVFVRGLLNPRGSCGRLIFDHAERYNLCVSMPASAELAAVNDRPSLARKIAAVGARNPAYVLQMLARARTVALPDPVPAVARDPNDDIFLATAAAEAAYLVSEDHDLLVLGEHAGTRARGHAHPLRRRVPPRAGRGGPEHRAPILGLTRPPAVAHDPGAG